MAQRYNTGNQRPSNSMKDLNDNALAYDDFLNSEADTFVDRMGNSQDSLRGEKKKMAAAGAAVTAKTGLGFELWHSSGAAGADTMARTGETAGATMATAGQRRRASRGESQRLAPGNDAATAVDEPA